MLLAFGIICLVASWQFWRSGNWQAVTIIDPRQTWKMAEIAYFAGVLALVLHVIFWVYSFTRGVSL